MNFLKILLILTYLLNIKFIYNKASIVNLYLFFTFFILFIFNVKFIYVILIIFISLLRLLYNISNIFILPQKNSNNILVNFLNLTFKRFDVLTFAFIAFAN